MKTKICLNCGDEFKPKTNRQSYCKQEKKKICPICNKEFTYQCGPDVRQTCSTECQAKLVKIKREKSASKQQKICKFCGLPFTPKSTRQVYCERKHYKTCVICGNQFEIDVRDYRTDNSTQTCSKECMKKLMSQSHDYVKGVETLRKTLQERYGEDVTNPMQISGVVDKIKNTNLEKYGTEWYTQTEEYKERIKETDLEKYGVKHHLKSDKIIAKRVETVKEKFGCENVFQSDEIKEKSKETSLRKYGVEHPSQSQVTKDLIEQHNIEKYGVKHPMMLDEFKRKAEKTNMERYGRRAYTQQHIANIQNWYSFITDPRRFISSHYNEFPTSSVLAKDLGVCLATIDEYISKNDSWDCIVRHRSNIEDEIISLIHGINPSMRIVHNDRSILKPKELDLYFPDHHFAIECNPTCTHNSSVEDPWGGEPKPRKYHQSKTDECAEQGVFLFHIFGYEWTHKKEIILSMIKNKLGLNENKIYARKCEIREVSWGETELFLNQNHRQGGASSPIRLGLFYDEELVSLMTFGKMRSGIGTGKENLDDCFELVRFCNKINTSVVGGASKLFKHFVKTYNPRRIRSFSDRAHTEGKLYPSLGFTEVALSDAGYVWVNAVSDVAYNRVNARKDNIKKFLKDDSIDLNKTETEIMIEHGFVQVFDSGTITWEWKCD